MKPVVSPLLLLVGLALHAGPAPVSASPTEAAPVAGRPAPDFEVASLLDGEKRSLRQYRGTVVLLNFWASWCSTCRTQMPELARLQAAFPPAAFSVVAVSTDRRRSAARRVALDTSLSYPLWFDSNREAARAYAVRGIPVSFLIDQTGTIVETVQGPREWSGPIWMERIAQMIESPEAP